MEESNFSDLLKRIREIRGFTQQELAHELDVTVGTLSNWENARHRPLRAQRRRIHQLADGSGVSASNAAAHPDSTAPSEAAAAATPKTGVQVIDLFSGCGGMSYGFSAAATKHVQYEVLGGLDIDRYANATYQRMLGRPALEEDVRDLVAGESLQKALATWAYDVSRPLLLIGCAPCQGFSSHRKKDPRKDARNDLLAAFAEVVGALQPDVVVMENVPEMLHRDHWPHYEAFRNRLAGLGYTVRARIFNLAGFGVPQERYRALILASRDRCKAEMPMPLRKPSEFTTVRQAIGRLPALVAGGASSHDPMHMTSKHRPETIRLLSLIPRDGGSRRSLPAGVGPDCHKTVDGFRDVYGRLWWDRPAVAITARCRTPSCGRFVHPEQDRGLSVREAALLQGFPSDFMFDGPFDDKYKQIGNAVSPMFARALAEHLDAAWVGAASQTDPSDDITKPISKSISSSIAGMKRQIRLAESAAGAK